MREELTSVYRSTPHEKVQAACSSRSQRQSRAAPSSYQDEIIRLNPQFLISIQIGLKEDDKQMTVTDLLEVGPYLAALGREDNVREVIAGILSQSPMSKKPKGVAPTSLLSSISEAEYNKAVLDDSEFSTGETREAADIQGLARKSTKQKKVAFNHQTPAAPTINNDERDAVRAWLQGRSMATDSPFFLTA